MPVLPPQVSAPYDTVNTVLNQARVRLNDELTTLLPVGGRLLKNNQIFSQQVTNTAWRKTQEYLGERGYARLLDEVVMFALPVVAIADPAVQVRLEWTGYFDGTNYFPSPALPRNLNHPLKVWERWSGQAAAFCDPPMEKILDGLPSFTKTTRNRCWEWRGDAIWMPGSLNVMDLRIRFVNFMDDFLDIGGVQWFQQPVPIMRCGDGMSWLMCAELAAAKGDQDLMERLTTRGEAALSKVLNLDVRADQRVNIRRRPNTGRHYRGNFL